MGGKADNFVCSIYKRCCELFSHNGERQKHTCKDFIMSQNIKQNKPISLLVEFVLSGHLYG